jgi:glycosyltransferase involved in cell wall biosynthesis
MVWLPVSAAPSLPRMPDRPHVCFLNRVYPPAAGATGAMLQEMAAGLVDRGWRVTVLTGPAEGAPASEETDNGVRVERVGALPFARSSTLWRGLAYASLFPAFVARAVQIPAPDVVVTKTDPPMLKVLGPLLARLTGAEAVHWAQDLYPEVAEALGVLPEDGLVANGLRRLSSWALRHHAHVVTVGHCMRERVLERGLSPPAVSVIPNWPPATVRPIPHDENPFRAAHDLEGRFVVMYSGNMGLAHPFDAVLDAAARLQDAAPEVLMLFVGAGPRKADLEAQVRRRGLDTVRFLPFQPKDRLAESLSAADLHLVTMRPGLEGLVVPSKVYGVLAAGRPALFLGPSGSEAARLLRTHDCGSVLPAPDGAALADAIIDWKAHPDRRREAGARARRVVDGARLQAVAAFDEVLRQVLQDVRPVAEGPN